MDPQATIINKYCTLPNTKLNYTKATNCLSCSINNQ